MALKIPFGPVHFVGVDLGSINVSLDEPGSVAYLRGVTCGDITVNAGTLFLDDVTCGDLVMDASEGSRLHAHNLRCSDIELNGGGGFQEVVIDGAQANQLVSLSTFDMWSVTNLIVGGPGEGSKIDVTDLSVFTLGAKVLNSNEHGIRFEDCAVGEVHTEIIDPSTDTDNTFDGISLQGVCDRIDLRGSVRGAINQANNPRYGLDVASGCLDIDVWLAITGAQTAPINDATSGEVTVH